MARRWYLLAEATAGRIGNQHILGPQHEFTRNERLSIRLQLSKKGSSQVQLPLPWNFMLEVANPSVDAPAYLLTDKGRPFASSSSFDNLVRKWIIAAGLCEPVLDDYGNHKKRKPRFRALRSQHGIRKRRAEQITEASGWSTKSWRICRTARKPPRLKPNGSIVRASQNAPRYVPRQPPQSEVSLGRKS